MEQPRRRNAEVVVHTEEQEDPFELPDIVSEDEAVETDTEAEAEEEEEEEESEAKVEESATEAPVFTDDLEARQRRLEAHLERQQRTQAQALEQSAQDEVVFSLEQNEAVRVACTYCQRAVKQRGRAILHCGHAVHLECHLRMFLESCYECRLCDQITVGGSGAKTRASRRQLSARENPVDWGTHRNTEHMLRLRVQLMEQYRQGEWNPRAISRAILERDGGAAQQQPLSSKKTQSSSLAHSRLEYTLEQQRQQLAQHDEIEAHRTSRVWRALGFVYQLAMNDGADVREQEQQRARQEHLRQTGALVQEIQGTDLPQEQEYLWLHTTTMDAVKLLALEDQNVFFATTVHEMVGRHESVLTLSQHHCTYESLLRQRITVSQLLHCGYHLLELVALGATYETLLQGGLTLDLFRRFRRDQLPVALLCRLFSVGFRRLYQTLFHQSMKLFCKVDWDVQELLHAMELDPANYETLRQHGFSKHNFYQMRHLEWHEWHELGLTPWLLSELRMTAAHVVDRCAYDLAEFKRVFGVAPYLLPSHHDAEAIGAATVVPAAPQRSEAHAGAAAVPEPPKLTRAQQLLQGYGARDLARPPPRKQPPPPQHDTVTVDDDDYEEDEKVATVRVASQVRRELFEAELQQQQHTSTHLDRTYDRMLFDDDNDMQ